MPGDPQPRAQCTARPPRLSENYWLFDLTKMKQTVLIIALILTFGCAADRLETRTYHSSFLIPRIIAESKARKGDGTNHFLLNTNGLSVDDFAVAYLSGLPGLHFPAGSSLRIDAQAQTITIRNTQAFFSDFEPSVTISDVGTLPLERLT